MRTDEDEPERTTWDPPGFRDHVVAARWLPAAAAASALALAPCAGLNPCDGGRGPLPARSRACCCALRPRQQSPRPRLRVCPLLPWRQSSPTLWVPLHADEILLPTAPRCSAARAQCACVPTVRRIYYGPTSSGRSTRTVPTPLSSTAGCMLWHVQGPFSPPTARVPPCEKENIRHTFLLGARVKLRLSKKKKERKAQRF